MVFGLERMNGLLYLSYQHAHMRETQWMIALFLTAYLCVGFAAQQGDRIICPRVNSTNMSNLLQASDPNKQDFVEVSGLGFSPTLVGPSGKPLIYAVNDSGGGRRFGIFDSGTGVRIKSLRLPRSSPFALDYESITVGSCGVDGESLTCIYIADVGDNTARDTGGARSGRNRTAYPIYKIREPNPSDFEDNGVLPDSYVSRLNFNYFHPTSPTRYADCESAFLDHVGWGGGSVGDLYLITKWDDYGSRPYPANTKVRLFKIPADAWMLAKDDANYTYLPEAVGSYSDGRASNALMGYMWTRAEMTFDGTVIALGDYYDQYLYLRCPGMSVADALAVKGTAFCETWPIKYWDSQFETIAWAPDGLSTLEISECYWSSCGSNPPMVWTTMTYEFDPNNSVICSVSTEVPPPTGPPAKAPPAPPSMDPTTQPPPAPTRAMTTPSPPPPTGAPMTPPHLPPTRAPTTPPPPPPTSRAPTIATQRSPPSLAPTSVPPPTSRAPTTASQLPSMGPTSVPLPPSMAPTTATSRSPPSMAPTNAPPPQPAPRSSFQNAAVSAFPGVDVHTMPDSGSDVPLSGSAIRFAIVFGVIVGAVWMA